MFNVINKYIKIKRTLHKESYEYFNQINSK